MAPPPIVIAHLGAGFPVGVVRWKQHGSHRLTVLAKLTFAADGASLAAEQVPFDGQIEEDRLDPGDHVPRKAGVDLFLRGSARGPSGAERFLGSIAIPSARRREAPVGTWRRDLLFETSPTAPLVSLADGHVLEADGVTRAGPLGRLGEPPPSTWRREPLGAAFDFATCHSAAPAQQLDALAPGCAIELGGALDFSGAGAIALPPAPWLYLDRGFGDGATLPLVCDTLTLDLDAATLVAVWRADFGLDEPTLADVDRILARWTAGGGEVDVDDVRGGMPRATFVLAEELGREADPADADLLHVARFEAMEVAASPELDVRTFARISAALAEGRPPRSEVLAKHELTEEAWSIEERAHGELLADRANYGDVENAVLFGEAFVAAQDALAEPSEADWSVERFAELTAVMEVTRDVPLTLADHGLTLGAFMRIDRRIGKILETDADARARYDEALELARAANPEEDLEDEEAPEEGEESA